MLLSVLCNSDICLLFSDFHTMPFPHLFYWMCRSLYCFQHSHRMKLLLKWTAPEIVSLLGIANMPCGFNSCIQTNIAPQIAKVAVSFESSDLYWIGKDDFFLLVAKVSNIYMLQSSTMSHLGISSYSLTKDLRVFCKVIINPDVMKRRHRKCQNVSGRSEDRAALWLPRTPGKPVHFPVLVVPKPLLLRNTYLSSAQRPVENSAATCWSSKCWESWKRLKWKCRVRTRDCNWWRFEGKWLRVPPANAELSILPLITILKAFWCFPATFKEIVTLAQLTNGSA